MSAVRSTPVLAVLACATLGPGCGGDSAPKKTPVTTPPAISISDASVMEDTGELSFTASLSAATSAAVSVQYATTDGTATAASDYTASSGTLTFAPGETTRTITVPLTDDDVHETDETLVVTLDAPAGATIATGQAQGTILDDDAPPSIAIAPASAPESAGELSFTVSLTGSTALEASVTYTTADGTATADGDYTASSGTLTFAPGETTRTITVPLTSDAVHETDETLVMTLDAPAGATIATGQAQGTILDDDAAPSIAIAPASAPESAGELSFTVSLTGATALEASVAYTTADGTATAGSDYTASSGTLTFAPGETTRTITVPLTDDAVHETDETLVVTLDAGAGGTIGTGSAQGTIVDDDAAPSIAIAPATGSESAGELSFTVSLVGGTALEATMAYATADGTATAASDYTASSGTLTFAPGETTRTITVPVTDDDAYEADETLLVVLSTPTGAAIDISEAVGTILDDDAAPTVDIADATATEGTGELTFTVSLVGATALEASVTYATSDGTAMAGSDYAASSGTLTFAPGETTGTITVPVLDDGVHEGDETVVVTLDASSGVSIGAGAAQGTILDDDAAPSVAIAPASASESAGELAFTVTLAGATALDASVTYATSDGTATVDRDYTPMSGTLTFAPGETTRTITVPVTDEAVYEEDETLLVDLSAPTGATIDTGAAAGTIVNDDPAPVVELAAAADSQLEDVGAVSLALTVAGATELPITLAFSVDPSSTAVSPGDYTIGPSPLVIPAGAAAAIELSLVHTPGSDPSRTVIVGLDGASGATLGTVTSETLTILDVDPPPLTLARAITMDADGDGRIDHYALVFSEPVEDASFPGYVADGVGTAQSELLVAGRDNVVLVTGTAAPVADAPDDAVLYVRFARSATADTDATPDVTTSANPSLRSLAGASLTAVAKDGVVEEDGAAPVLLAATSETGVASVSLFFSEPVASSGTCPGGSVDVSAFDYLDVSASGVSGFVAGSDGDGCDGAIELGTTPVATTAADPYVDQVSVAADALYDLAGNVATTAPVVLTGVVHPYVLDVVSVDQVTVRVDYSEPVEAVAALDPASYSLAAASGCGTPALSGGIELTGDSYEFTTSPQSSSCTYTLTVVGDVRDVDEGATLVEPRSGSFIGLQPLQVVSATALSLRTFVIELSKPVLADGPGGASNSSYYSIPSTLGSVISALRYDAVTGKAADASRVLVTHSADQGSSFYSVIVSPQLRNAAATETLAASPYDRTTFQGLGGDVTTISQGELFSDPFGDGTTFSFVFVYRGKVYAGPNDQNDAVFRFDPDGSNAITATFSTSSATAGGPFTSFGENVTRPAQTVTSPGGTVTRYYVTPGTDLSKFAPGDRVAVAGCTNVVDNRAGAITALSAAEDWVELDSGVAPVVSTAETCQVTLWNDAGPADFDGIDAFVSATVAGSEYLVFGSHNLGGGGFGELYFTRNDDTRLDNDYCAISGVTLGNTQSLQTIYGWGDTLYVGFASDSPSGMPLFATLNLSATGGTCAALNDTVVSPSKQIKYLDYLGRSGTHPNTAANVGIDSMLVFDDGSGPALYLANNGGIARSSDLPPVGTTVWTNVRHDGDGVWTGTTQPIPGIGKLRPGQKGVPQMLAWGGALLVARNRIDNGAAEVWKYAPPTWTRIIDTSSTAGGMNTNDRRVSMLAVSGSRLYVGFDNATDGAEVWRTKDGVTAATLASQMDLEQVGLSGLGPAGASDLARNKQIISHTTVSYQGQSYLYFTVGCDTDFTDNGACDRDATVGHANFAIRMFRQVD